MAQQLLLLSSSSSSSTSNVLITTHRQLSFSSNSSTFTLNNNNSFFNLSPRIPHTPKLLLSVKCRHSSSSSTGLPPRVFVGHSIYKGKAALTVVPRAPEFVPLESGPMKISREGFILLQFAPATGVRQYDWSKKQMFSLSVAEIGSLISLGARESCEFFHDPKKGRSDEGKVSKVFKVEPLPDGSGHFFNLSVQNKLLNIDESIYIPISKAEFAVLVSAFTYILPYLMGWHAFAESIRAEDSNRFNNSNSRSSADYEWSR